MKRHGALVGSNNGYEFADPFGPNNPYLDELHEAYRKTDDEEED